MRRRTNLQDPRSAGALVALMVVLPLILIALAAYSHRGFAEMQATSRENVRAHALYIAQAALHKAAGEVLRDPDYRGESRDVPFAGGRYSYAVEGGEAIAGLGDRFRVRAAGSYGEPGQDPVGVGLEVILAPSSLSVIDHAIATRGRIVLGADATIGDPGAPSNLVHAGFDGPGGESLALEGAAGSSIHGRVRLVTEEPQASPPSVVPGPLRQGVEPLPFPTFDLAALEAKARANTSNPRYPGGAYFSGRTTFRDETLRGVVFVDGEVVLRGTVTVDRGCIVATTAEPFTVHGDLTVRPDDDPVDGAPELAILKVGGALLKFSSGRRLDLEGFVFTDGPVRVEAFGEIRGGIVADTGDSVRISGRCALYHVAVDLADLASEVEVTPIDGLVVEGWMEDPDHLAGSPRPGLPGPSGEPSPGAAPR